MRIEWAILCRFVEVHDGLATMIGAGIDNVTVQNLPVEVGSMCALRIAVAPGDTGRKHNLVVKVLAPDLSEINTIQGDFQAHGQPHSQPGWEGHHTLPMAISFPAESAGPYTIHFVVGDSTFDMPLMISTP